MRTKLLLAATLSALLTGPAMAATFYGNSITGDEPVPGAYLNGPQVVVPAPIVSQAIPFTRSCVMRGNIHPGSEDLTATWLSGDHDPVPGVYNTTVCG